MAQFKVVLETGEERREHIVEAPDFRSCVAISEAAAQVANELCKRTGKPLGRLVSVEEVSNGSV